MYERFIGITKQNRTKTYIVANESADAIFGACKALKTSIRNIFLQPGWVIGEDLYLKNPKRKGQKKIWVASYGYNAANNPNNHLITL